MTRFNFKIVAKSFGVIDDDAVIRQTLCMILNGQGYRAIEAENSQQAEHQFGHNKVESCITDSRE